MFYVSCPQGIYLTEGPFPTEEDARECALDLSADSAEFFDGDCRPMLIREGAADGEVVATVTADAPLDPESPDLSWESTQAELDSLGG
jgi:hypothetical protein